ncbi:MAG TPA: MnmC family methyltransferase [Chthoniobacterales bacterium]|nr:MnmC family methyltransferase [Chthoniobacterales bacterium]
MKQKQAEISKGAGTPDDANAPGARALGDYEIHQAWEGFASIRQISSGEIMHSRTAPLEEARRIYVEQAHLAQRLRDQDAAGELVLWDVGLGAGANAMAAIACCEEVAATGIAAALCIISFENDLDSLRLAARHPEQFPYLAHEAPAALLEHGHWRSKSVPNLTWTLIPGDFVERMSDAQSAPDLVFYDMFSSRTSGRLWAFPTFRRLFEICGAKDVELFTYTCSTANRAALLAAGFFVARGRNAGPKIETTIALTPLAASHPKRAQRDFLSRDWLAKWDRSTAKFPPDVGASDRPQFEKSIREHKQFRNS